MDYHDLFKTLENPPKVMLFSGVEEYVKESALQALEKALIPEGTAELGKTTLQGAVETSAIIEACETLPFWGGKRLIVVRDYPYITSDDAKKMSDDEQKRLLEYLMSVPDHAVLLFYVRANADKRKAIYKTIVNLGGVVEFPELSEREVVQWCNQYVRAVGKTIGYASVQVILCLQGRLLYPIKECLDKLIAYVGDEPEITRNAINQIVIPSIEDSIYKLADYWLDGQFVAASYLMNSVVRRGTSLVSIIALLSHSFRRMLMVKTLADTGMGEAQIAKLAAMPSFAVKMAVRQVRGKAVALFTFALEALEEADFAIKSGEMDDQMAFYLAYGKIVNRFKAA